MIIDNLFRSGYVEPSGRGIVDVTNLENPVSCEVLLSGELHEHGAHGVGVSHLCHIV